MAAFELRDTNKNEEALAAEFVEESKRPRQECIIALKVYDSCRQLECK